MLNYLVEFIGTFVFLSVILRTGEALPIAVALAICFSGAVSGGHFNPAVNAMLLKNNHSAGDYIPCVVFQVAWVCALYFYQMTKAKSK